MLSNKSDHLLVVKFTEFGRWKWMHYDAINDLAICHLCIMGAT